jgi:hypothetical protein
MEISLWANYLRFVAMFLSVFYINQPWTYVGLTFLSTVGYNLISAFFKQTTSGLIAHKCISHVPSTVLIVVSCYYDRGFRPVFIITGAIQYLNMWLLMYSEVFTKELRNQIIKKESLKFANEVVWAFNDV